MNLCDLTIHDLHERLKKREITATAIVESVSGRIREVEERVTAYITLTCDRAVARAEEIDEKIKRGTPLTPLTGIPLAIKDNLCTRGIRTTCASRILKNFVPPYDATVVERLRREEAIIIGKTNMDEFAMGSSTETSAFGVTKNPWALDRIPGGSSGGSAAAIAAGECIAALGSDTGGSVRLPGSFCGVVGIKPTYGRVSRYGLVAYASSLDQIGPITKDVTDAALLLTVISGHDPRDSTSADIPVPDFTRSLVSDLHGVTVGIPREYFGEGIDPEVEGPIREALTVLKERGATVREISLPHTPYAIAAYYIVATAEASSNLARYDGVRYGPRVSSHELREMYKETRTRGFGVEVRRRIMLGTYALSAGYYDAYYRKAQQVRTLIKGDFDAAFQSVDLIITPVAPTPAFRIGEKIEDPLQMYLSDIFTISINLAGVPAISVPCGFSRGGLPIGMQIVGRHFDEERVLQAAYAFEQATEWHTKRPVVT